MVFEWFGEHRRQKITEEPFPEAWEAILQENLPVYALLDSEEQARLRDDLRILIAEKSWEGCGGLTLTDEIQVTIAAQASLLTLGREPNYFPKVESILVYPADYRARDRQRDPSGVVDEGVSGRLGEAWSDGPVVLSWSDALQGGRNMEDGHNVVYHEFAHKLDMDDNDANGVPTLDTEEQVQEWEEVMTAEFAHLIAAAESGHETVLDSYGATNPAEFFAVSTECFFEKPLQMLHKHPNLYRVLQGYYRQDPADRLHAAHAPAETE